MLRLLLFVPGSTSKEPYTHNSEAMEDMFLFLPNGNHTIPQNRSEAPFGFPVFLVTEPRGATELFEEAPRSL